MKNPEFLEFTLITILELCSRMSDFSHLEECKFFSNWCVLLEYIPPQNLKKKLSSAQEEFTVVSY